MSQVCGLNYQLEGPLSEPIPIKEDAEYPDWLFKMDIKRPKPPLEEQVGHMLIDINTEKKFVKESFLIFSCQ